MLRGYIHSICPNCGHRFTALDIEDGATVRSMPVRCPACGHSFRPSHPSVLDSLSELFKLLKRKE